jgi:hypothetical protein
MFALLILGFIFMFCIVTASLAVRKWAIALGK